LRSGFSSFRQNNARGGRGFRFGLGLRTGGLGGLRGVGVEEAGVAAPAPVVVGVGVAVAFGVLTALEVTGGVADDLFASLVIF